MASSVAKVLVFAGSAREGSLNKQLAKLAARRIEALGGKATFIDLKAYPCPLFDEDIEAQGMPENVLKLREILADHQALLIASPEYNGFITPLLKNTLDWLSRPYGDTPGLGLFAGKWAALVASSGTRRAWCTRLSPHTSHTARRARWCESRNISGL